MNNYLLKNIIESKGISLNDKNLSLLESIFVKREIKKDEFFLKEGDESLEVGLVLSGVFRSFYIDKNGDDITKYFYAEEHVCSFKLLNSGQRYEEFKNKYPGLEKRVKQYQLASYLGVTPVSLSRIKKNLKINK